jgi:hypothetical protein
MSAPTFCQTCGARDDATERGLSYDHIAVMNALEMFVTQWNAFGPNSEAGDAFKKVRAAAVKALGTDAPKYRADLFK